MRISDFIRDVKNRIYSLSMNLHKHQLRLLEQHSESFKIWSTIIRIINEGKSLIMKLGPDTLVTVTVMCTYMYITVVSTKSSS